MLRKETIVSATGLVIFVASLSLVSIAAVVAMFGVVTLVWVTLPIQLFRVFPGIDLLRTADTLDCSIDIGGLES